MKNEPLKKLKSQQLWDGQGRLLSKSQLAAGTLSDDESQSGVFKHVREPGRLIQHEIPSNIIANHVQGPARDWLIKEVARSLNNEQPYREAVLQEAFTDATQRVETLTEPMEVFTKMNEPPRLTASATMELITLTQIKFWPTTDPDVKKRFAREFMNRVFRPTARDPTLNSRWYVLLPHHAKTFIDLIVLATKAMTVCSTARPLARAKQSRPEAGRRVGPSGRR